MPRKCQNKKKGFTIIEALVAIVILLIAILGPLALLSSAIRESGYAKDQIIASFLAQEGVELAYATLQGKSDITETDANPCLINDCIAYTNTLAIETPIGSDTVALYVNPTASPKVYKPQSETTGTPTKSIFSRKIKYEKYDVTDPTIQTALSDFSLGPTVGIKITSTVNWMYKGSVKSAIASTVVYETY